MSLDHNTIIARVAPVTCAMLALMTAPMWLAASAFASEKPEILARADWGAKPAITDRMTKQTPHEIIVHHTGVRQQPKVSLERKLRGLQGYSQNTKKWGDSPYHYYIGVSGRIGAARDVAYAGDTNTKYSVKNRIQVVVEGHFDRNTPTRKQLSALENLVVWLAGAHQIPADAISGHNDHAQTDCPGKKLKPHLGVLRKMVAAKAEHTKHPSPGPNTQYDEAVE